MPFKPIITHAADVVDKLFYHTSSIRLIHASLNTGICSYTLLRVQEHPKSSFTNSAHITGSDCTCSVSYIVFLKRVGRRQAVACARTQQTHMRCRKAGPLDICGGMTSADRVVPVVGGIDNLRIAVA